MQVSYWWIGLRVMIRLSFVRCNPFNMQNKKKFMIIIRGRQKLHRNFVSFKKKKIATKFNSARIYNLEFTERNYNKRPAVS